MLYEQAGLAVEGLGKRFGELWALSEVSFQVPPGKVLGLLGHNGAGKTTAIRILTTLATPSAGRAQVAGFDVVKQAAEVRQRIGVAGQTATVDGLLSARKNLEMIGRLYHLPRAEVRRRSEELLAQVELSADADRLVKTFSGGMRRRLDLAASLISSPPVLFLDEPTTGLDPHSRSGLWDILRARVKDGTTLVLTTQYLEEADRLADDIVLLDHGKIAAHGTPAALKTRIGGERIVVTLQDVAVLSGAAQALAPFGAASVDEASRQVAVAVRPGIRLMELVRALDGVGIEAHDLQRREVSLDDVFLSLTGKPGTAAPVAVAS
jgi:ABC-2 type transport system ATP-binding protein